MFNWHKKEKPLQGLTGMGGGVVSRLLGSVSSDPGGGPFSVSGGNATSTAGDYKYFYFTSSGSLVVANDGTDAPMLVDFMLVGQGGQGQGTGGGGGGAGAFIQKVNYELGPFPGSPTTCPVSINQASFPMPDRTPGLTSEFVIPVNPKTFTAPGGGGGVDNQAATNGGGGGRPGTSGGPPGVDPYTAIDDDGNTPDSGIRGAGGDGLYTQIAAPPGGVGGGGGGAGGDGGDGANPSGPPGGSAIAGKGGLGRAAFLGDTGIPSSYGTSGPGPGRWFAGGGGGGNHDAPPPAGGAAPDAGGGGAGGVSSSPPTPVSGAGTVNTGGGGGGGGGLANAYPGPLGQGGGTGILIVRIATSRLS